MFYQFCVHGVHLFIFGRSFNCTRTYRRGGRAGGRGRGRFVQGSTWCVQVWGRHFCARCCAPCCVLHFCTAHPAACCARLLPAPAAAAPRLLLLPAAAIACCLLLRARAPCCEPVLLIVPSALCGVAARIHCCSLLNLLSIFYSVVLLKYILAGRAGIRLVNIASAPIRYTSDWITPAMTAANGRRRPAAAMNSRNAVGTPPWQKPVRALSPRHSWPAVQAPHLLSSRALISTSRTPAIIHHPICCSFAGIYIWWYLLPCLLQQRASPCLACNLEL